MSQLSVCVSVKKKSITRESHNFVARLIEPETRLNAGLLNCAASFSFDGLVYQGT
jgi:hypothetical protein